MTSLPTQGQLVLPLLDALERGGAQTTPALVERVANDLGIDEAARAHKATIAGRAHRRFNYDLRWAQTRARLQGLVAKDSGCWQITDKGRRSLTQATPGTVITIFTTDAGCALFARVEDGIGYLDDNSVDLLFTSPPYPILNKKSYGGIPDETAYVEWLLRIVESTLPKLKDSSSLVLNLGDAWVAGKPFISTYQEELILRLRRELSLNVAQRMTWWNRSALPAPAHWTTIKRVRLKQATESLWWLAKGEPKASNLGVLQPYSARMEEVLAAGGANAGVRPSGHVIDPGGFATRHAGSIPPNILDAPNSGEAKAYLAGCRDRGLPVHPARMPKALPEFFIKLTTEPDDLVLDPFGGSGTTARAAEDLGRRWITFDATRDFVEGARLRFPDALPLAA